MILLHDNEGNTLVPHCPKHNSYLRTIDSYIYAQILPKKRWQFWK